MAGRGLPSSSVQEIAGAVGERTRKKPRKLAWLASRFHILINTNHDFTLSPQRADEVREWLRRRTKALPPPIYELEHRDMLKFYDWAAQGVPASKPRASAQDYRDLVESVRLVFVFETGGETGYLHEHIDMQINHYSCVKMDAKNFTAYFRELEEEFPEIRGMFIRIKRVKADMTESYFSKNMMEAPGLSLSKDAKEAVDRWAQGPGATFSIASGGEDAAREIQV